MRGGQGRGLRAKYERCKQSSRKLVNAADLPAQPDVTVLTGTHMRSMLVGCSVPSERAQRSLQLLLRRSSAVEGQLYWHRESGRELVAQVGEGSLDPGLTHFLDDYVRSQLEDQELNTRSGEGEAEEGGLTSSIWIAQDGAQHHAVLLSHQTPQGFAITGLAILRAPPGAKFEHPTALASSLSRALLDAGDVVPIVVS